MSYGPEATAAFALNCRLVPDDRSLVSPVQRRCDNPPVNRRPVKQSQAPPASGDGQWAALELARAASSEVETVLLTLETVRGGLTSGEALRRLREHGPNAVRSHGARALSVLLRQLKSPLLILLLAAASTSLLVGERTGAGIIIAIMVLSIGLGFINEYRAERAVEALHSRIRHMAVTMRDGRATDVNVIDLVPGDVVRLDVGDVVPADLRLFEVNALECDEAVLTGEATPAEKQVAPTPAGQAPLALPACAFMGTVVRNGTGWGVVVQTGSGTAFGRIAVRLGEQQLETAFQVGLREFSGLLVQVTAVLTISIFAINAALQRPILESALFALAIAVGLTPQLLPAIVTISLSTGARRLARKAVLVKRLVSIEDLGNIEVLFTDKTGTLTEGRITFREALNVEGNSSPEVLRLGLLCNGAVVQTGIAVGGNALDRALWEAEEARNADIGNLKRAGEAPFDYERRLMSVLVEDAAGRQTMITKGAPEAVLARCAVAPSGFQAVLGAQFESGRRVIAVATARSKRPCRNRSGGRTRSDPRRAPYLRRPGERRRGGIDCQAGASGRHSENRDRGQRQSCQPPVQRPGHRSRRHPYRRCNRGNERRFARTGPANHDDLCQGHTGPEVAHHPCPTHPWRRRCLSR